MCAAGSLLGSSWVRGSACHACVGVACLAIAQTKPDSSRAIAAVTDRRWLAGLGKLAITPAQPLLCFPRRIADRLGPASPDAAIGRGSAGKR